MIFTTPIPRRYLRVVLCGEEIDRFPWMCFWLIAREADRHGIESPRLTFVDAASDFVMDRWVLTFVIDEEAVR